MGHSCAIESVLWRADNEIVSCLVLPSAKGKAGTERPAPGGTRALTPSSRRPTRPSAFATFRDSLARAGRALSLEGGRGAREGAGQGTQGPRAGRTRRQTFPSAGGGEGSLGRHPEGEAPSRSAVGARWVLRFNRTVSVCTRDPYSVILRDPASRTRHATQESDLGGPSQPTLVLAPAASTPALT